MPYRLSKASLAVLTLAAACAFAAPPSTPPEPAKSGGVLPDTASVDFPETIIIRIDFPGGSAADYLRELIEVSGYQNIVIDSDLEHISIPPVSLDGVSVLDAVQMIESITGQAAYIKQNGRVLVCKTNQVFSPPSPPRLETHVWSLNEIIDMGGDADDALAAVELALGGSRTDADLKFHESTGLLIARATTDDLTVIDQLLETLEDAWSARTRPAQNREMAARLQSLEAQLAAAQRDSTDAKQRQTDEMSRNQALRQQIEALESTSTHRITELEVRLQAALIEVDELKAKLADATRASSGE